MQSSLFNLRVPVPGNDVFLMNTLTDAQLLVSADVAALLDRPMTSAELAGTSGETREAIDLLRSYGFLVPGRDHDRQALEEYLAAVRSDSSELNVTVLTTLQCNFACGYCYQGDRDDWNKFAQKMSLETSARVAAWIEREMDRVHPETFVLTFFGGEPLLNLPVMYDLAERLWRASVDRGIPQSITIITNGLLLTEDVVDRLLPYGLAGVKVTLDGDRDTHNRMRPLRGGQGTFDRIIENIRRISDRCPVGIGGNFDETSADSYPALLDFLKEQDFADRLVKVNFKPIVRTGDNQAGSAAARAGAASSDTRATPAVSPASSEGRPGRLAAERAARGGILPLTPVRADGKPIKPLGGTCMTSAGAGGGSTCDSCRVLDDTMTRLREETRRRGFPTPDGVHNGPCHVHMQHAHTIGPDGSLYACPGFTGDLALSIGHIDDRADARRIAAREDFDRLSPWTACGDCAFIPVCAGGCVASSHATLGDMNAPTCHKPSYESALISLAHQVAGAA